MTSRTLMRTRQPLGILPSLWFWEEVCQRRPLLSGLIALPLGLSGMVFGLWLVELLPLVYGLVVAICVPVLGFGAIERMLRRAVQRRVRRMPGRA